MKRTSFYPIAVPLGGIGLSVLDHGEDLRKEVILKNSFADKNKVSKMKLEVIRMMAIDEAGNEIQMIRFHGGTTLEIEGIFSGKYMRTNSINKLESGRYTHFRFYLNAAVSKFYGSNREVSPVYQECLDFEIEGGLDVEKNNPELVMRFDLPAFEPSGFYKWLENSIINLSKVRMRRFGFPSSVNG